MRVFAAIELPHDVVNDLRDHLPWPRSSVLRWTAPASWHLTVAFFGSMSDDDVADLRDRLRRAAHRHRGLILRLAGSGQFGRRVLWAGVSGDVDPLRSLARSVATAGRDAGADVDDEAPYRPHLTLARVPSPRATPDDPVLVGATLDAAEDALRTYRGPTWTAPAFTLVRSERGAGENGRARYTPLETFALTVGLTERAPDTAPEPDLAPADRAAPTDRR